MSLFCRCFKRKVRDKTQDASPHSGHKDELHSVFRTKPGCGPFLRSPDGRVIPLRKAHFLQDK